MPTVILLDTSLSMLQQVSISSVNASATSDTSSRSSIEEVSTPETLFSLAQHGLNLLLDHLQANCKLEHVCLLTFAKHCELTCQFTRDIANLKSLVPQETCFDKSQVMSGLIGVSQAVFESWGSNVTFPIDLILITDGGMGQGPHSLTHFTEKPQEYRKILPFNFKGSMSVLYVNRVGSPPESSSDFLVVKDAYEKLIELSGLEGQFIYPDSKELNKESAERMVKRVIETQYNQYVGHLHFGNELKCKIFLCPPPAPAMIVKDFETIEAKASDIIDIKGFFSMADVASPPVLSRHLILPWTSKEQTDEDSRTPNLCVLLHGALKVEGLCALVQVTSNWFGLVFSSSDKKKSNLTLALFEPGDSPVPWLGNFQQLGPLAGLNSSNQDPFPVKGNRKPSYSSAPVVWIKQASLHSDVQKILRHARKIPDKTPHFYKELNRLKRHALCIGFHELLEGVAEVLDKECPVLPSSSNPECIIQLNHAAKELKSLQARDLDYIIQPLQTKFNKTN